MQTMLRRAPTGQNAPVSDVMGPATVRIAPDATARQAAARLAYYDLTSLPVVDRRGRLIGVLAASDVLRLRHVHGGGPAGSSSVPSPLDSHRVDQIMLPDLFGVGPDTPLSEVADLVERSGIDRVFVTEDGVLRGMVTTADLVRVWGDTTRR